MRKLAPFLGIIVAFACQDSTPVQLEELSTLAHVEGLTGAADQMVPFKGKGTWSVVDQALGCEGDAANSAASLAGELNVTHLGLSTWSALNCWTPAFEFISQTATLTAANGDQLFWYGSVGMGTVVTFPTPNTYELGPVWFGGGTGRFAGASGTTYETGFVADDLLSGTIHLDGMLSSVGSSK